MKDENNEGDFEEIIPYASSSKTFSEQDERRLRSMMGKPSTVDLDWYPGMYEDQEEEIQLDQETINLQAQVYECMNEIGNIDECASYEKLKWNEDMVNHVLFLIPVEIQLVQGPTGKYPRFWGYICQLYPEDECIEAKKATISIPTGLFKRIEMFRREMLQSRTNPLEDSMIYIISTIYQGLQEFEVDGETRKVHKFWMTKVIDGYRSE
ncbi:MAG: hypothetical protein RTU92_06725 [Candidatus Thorarchaeota archaeon]